MLYIRLAYDLEGKKPVLGSDAFFKLTKSKDLKNPRLATAKIARRVGDTYGKINPSIRSACLMQDAGRMDINQDKILYCYPVYFSENRID